MTTPTKHYEGSQEMKAAHRDWLNAVWRAQQAENNRFAYANVHDAFAAGYEAGLATRKEKRDADGD